MAFTETATAIELSQILEERNRRKPITQVLSGREVAEQPHSYFKGIAKLMARVYAEPPFNEVAKRDNGEICGFDGIRKQYPETSGATNEHILDRLNSGSFSDLQPYYSNVDTANSIANQATTPGVHPIFANIYQSEANDPIAHAAAFVCSDTRARQQGDSAMAKAQRLMCAMPYGRPYSEEIISFLDRVEDENKLAGKKVLLLGELCVDPRMQGKGLGRKVSAALSPQAFIHSQNGLRPFERHGVFITVYSDDMTEEELKISAMGTNVRRAKKAGIPVTTQRLGDSSMSIVYTPRALETFVPELRGIYRVGSSVYSRLQNI